MKRIYRPHSVAKGGVVGALFGAMGCTDSAESTPTPVPDGSIAVPEASGPEARPPPSKPDVSPVPDVVSTPGADHWTPSRDASHGVDADARADAAEGGSDAARDGGVALLSATGLYADIDTEALGDGVRSYQVRFPLWSDGAAKRRWFSLPPGTRIDTTDMDEWRFPIGTKLWKEFTRDGVRIETRLIEKIGEGSTAWTYVAYVWNDAQTDAVAMPEGVDDSHGTEHDVPGSNDCYACHSGSRDFVLGVSALQLAHDTSALTPAERLELGVTMDDLIADDLLSDPPTASDFELPGDDLARRALGILHSNCGNCHRPGTIAFERAEMDLHLTVATLGDVTTTPIYATSVGKETSRLIEEGPDGGTGYRIDPGSASTSAVYRRMASRADGVAMPPIASELVDTEGAEVVFDWIQTL